MIVSRIILGVILVLVAGGTLLGFRRLWLLFAKGECGCQSRAKKTKKQCECQEQTSKQLSK